MCTSLNGAYHGARAFLGFFMSKLLLEIRNIEKEFGSCKALNGVSLNLEEGKIISLLGVNGAGKTTLSSIIATLRPPTKGDILFNGVSIYDNVPKFKSTIGYCPQKPNLNTLLTVRENLEASGRYYGIETPVVQERITFLAQQLRFQAYLNHYPPTLSGGYKQRILIARSIIHQPQLVILDEPTVALDPHIRHQLWEYIRGLRQQGVTVLLTTHYLDEAEVLSDYVCVLDKGTVRLIDTPENLKASFQKSRLEDVFIQLINESQEL